MADNPSLDELTRRLGELAQRQQLFQQEITDLQRLIYDLKRKEIAEGKVQETKKEQVPPPIAEPIKPKVIVEPTVTETPPVVVTVKPKKPRTPLEEFIGTNLLNKIGIAVLVIGVGIGAEYAIENNLISPVLRIFLGYLCGIILIGLAIRLKPKFTNFSAVLLSGGLAVLYFITFAAYDLYALMPQSVAFVLMVAFTAFTVFASIQYNMVVVALIGLVGAYAVPVMLSDGSGRVVVLFSYMTIINSGILIIGFRKHWKQLYYTAFALTWLIFMSWYFDQYSALRYLTVELVFSSVFFVTFYTTLLAYKLVRGENLGRWDVVLLLINSFVYFGFGYDAIESHENGELFLGLFTVFNALLHFAACVIIFRQKGQSRDIFFFAAGLVLVFITLAVPVQLEGNWVTVIWSAEAALLFWIGRTKRYPVYEKLSYPLLLLALISLVQDWGEFYGHYAKGVAESHVTPILNTQFLTSMLFCIAFGMVLKISRDKQFTSPLKPESLLSTFMTGAIPALLLITLYVSFFLEINNYWDQRFIDSEINIQQGEEYSYHIDEDLNPFRNLWLFNYSALFVMAMAAVQLRWIKTNVFSFIIFASSSLVLFIFITAGLGELRVLLNSYIFQVDAEYYSRTIGYVLIRYASILFMIPLLWVNYKLSRGEGFEDFIRKGERVFFHIVILALLSSELVSALALARITDSDKLVLSILWGIYALGLIVYGLKRELKYIRITAIALFGITLLKLFFYDLTGMSTIAKTVVMIVLGALLLVASFLYNKFKKPTHVSPQ